MQKSQSQIIQAQLEEKIIALNKAIAEKNQLADELKRQLEKQQALCLQYHNALVDLEATQQDQLATLERNLNQKEAILEKIQNTFMEKNINDQQLADWMLDLKRLFNALEDSRRWQFGNKVGQMIEVLRLQPKSPTAFTYIKSIFDQFDKRQTSFHNSTTQSTHSHHQSSELLCNWMRQLQTDFKLLINSRRWRWGNYAVQKLNKLFFRPKIALATDQMAIVFADFENWRRSRYLNQAEFPLSDDDIGKLHKWLNALDHYFHMTMGSRRWRLGHAMVSVLRFILLQRPRPLVTDHMEAIFFEYRQQYPL